MKPEPKITNTEWLAELARLSNRSDEGLTCNEWAAETGMSKGNMRMRLKGAQEAGWLKVGRRRITALDGKQAMIPVYHIIKPKGGIKK